MKFDEIIIDICLGVYHTATIGLVSSGSKPLPQPLLAKIYEAIWRHEVTPQCVQHMTDFEVNA